LLLGTIEDYAFIMNRLLLIVFALCAAASNCFAEDKIISNVDGKVVNYFYESCPEECQVATLTCNDGGTIGVILADIDAKNAAKAISTLKKQMVLKAGKKSFDYAVTEMDFMEMTVSWWLTAIPDSVNMRELAPAIGATKVVEASVGGQKVTLPVDKAVKGWATACK
jgi:hypothetical protein